MVLLRDGLIVIILSVIVLSVVVLSVTVLIVMVVVMMMMMMVMMGASSRHSGGFNREGRSIFASGDDDVVARGYGRVEV
jgi:hypothetical protein